MSIDDKIKNLDWYGQQLQRLAVEYKSVAEFDDFISNTRKKGVSRHLYKLAQNIRTIAKEIKESI